MASGCTYARVHALEQVYALEQQIITFQSGDSVFPSGQPTHTMPFSSQDPIPMVHELHPRTSRRWEISRISLGTRCLINSDHLVITLTS